VLEKFAPMAPGVFLYYPSRAQMMPKLRAFIDHVKSRPRDTVCQNESVLTARAAEKLEAGEENPHSIRAGRPRRTATSNPGTTTNGAG
jgi:hypothetical protein